MRKPSFSRCGAWALCAAAVSLGAVFCLATAFGLPVDTVRVMVVCLTLSVLFPLLLSWRRWGIGFVLALALAGLWLWRDWAVVRDSVLLLLEKIFWHYGRAFQELSFLKELDFALPPETRANGVLYLLGGFLAFVTAWTVCGSYSLLPLALVSLPPLVLCLLVVNTTPAPWCLCLLLGGWVLLVLSQGPRRRGAEGHRLVLRLALPLAALMGLLCLMVKPADYVRPAWPDKVQEKIEVGIENVKALFDEKEGGGLAALVEAASGGLGRFSWNSDPERTDLTDVGPQGKSGIRAMEVLSTQSGRLYLRGYSLAAYDGTSWSALTEDAYLAENGEGEWLSLSLGAESVRVKTDRKSSLYYLPYGLTEFPADGEEVLDAWVENPAGNKSYTARFAPEGVYAHSEGYEQFVYANYLEVPDSTREALADITDALWEENGNIFDARAIAASVERYVSQSAVYDLDTPAMPDGEKDFAVWFLKERDTGYCVHFASAAAVLMRCMGVPARYVSGYAATVRAGDWSSVSQDDAHAWVEYYVQGEGWFVLEATPAAEPVEEVAPEPENSAAPEETPPQASAVPEEKPAATASGNLLDRPGKVNVGGGEKGTFRVPAWLWLLLALAALPLLWRCALRRVRRGCFEAGEPSRRALALGRHIRRLSRALGQPVPDFVRGLEEKALFSRHGAEEGDVSALSAYAETLHAAAREEARPLRRLLVRLAFAL